MLDTKKIKRVTPRVERATSYNNLDIARPIAVVSHAASTFGFPKPEGKSKMLKSSRLRIHDKDGKQWMWKSRKMDGGNAARVCPSCK